jgi:hypothetical protein
VATAAAETPRASRAADRGSPAGCSAASRSPARGSCAADVSSAEPVSRGTNGFSIASLVLGIVWIYWIGSILALVFGYIAKSQIDRSGGAQGGRGMAIAGIVLGWIGIASLILVIIIVAAGVASEP